MEQRMRLISSFLIALIPLLSLISSPVYAQEECPRGTLDPRYCDRDRDLIADLPLDEDDWLDPSALIFSYTPVEDPAVYEQVWAGFIAHLEEVIDKRILFFPVQSYAAQYEAMRSGRLRSTSQCRIAGQQQDPFIGNHQYTTSTIFHRVGSRPRRVNGW